MGRSAIDLLRVEERGDPISEFVALRAGNVGLAKLAAHSAAER